MREFAILKIREVYQKLRKLFNPSVSNKKLDQSTGIFIFNEQVHNHIANYRNKADVLRVIHSIKAESCRKLDLTHTVAIVVIGAIITFFGFMGSDRFLLLVQAFGYANQEQHSALAVNATHSLNIEEKLAKDKIESITPTGLIATTMNDKTVINEVEKVKIFYDIFVALLTLLLFTASLLNLIFRWKEENVSHFEGVVKLTRYINWLDEFEILIERKTNAESLRAIRGRYQVIVESLPQNADSDFMKAKKSMSRRSKTLKSIASEDSRNSQVEKNFADLFRKIINQSPQILRVLMEMRDTNTNLWLGGGAVRNLVWDRLTERKTPPDDFDIVYFDESINDSDTDVDLQNKLQMNLPGNLKISVKNQAWMHSATKEPRPNSLNDAIGFWPETATAVIIRIDKSNNIQIIAPYGLADLINMVIRPTPYHSANCSSFNKRMISKEWERHWPEIVIKLK